MLLRGGAVAVIVTLALLAIALTLLRIDSTADAFTLTGPAYPAAGQTLNVGNEAVLLEFVSVSAGFNNEFGRSIPGPTETFFFCQSAPPGTIDGGRYSGPSQELRFFLTTPAQGSPSEPRTFFTGPASNNPDNFPHARMAVPDPIGEPNVVRLEWEDLLNGGDEDYNDCIIDITITPLASLTIEKNVIPDDASVWDFTIDGPDAESDRTITDLADGGSQTENLLSAGSYTVTETSQGGYSTSVDCGSKGSEPDNDIVFTLDPGDDVTCTFANTKDATITIIKDADPDDAQDFSFSGTCFTAFSLDDDADGTLSNTKGPDVHATGSCTVIENGPPTGWVFTSLVCVDPDSGTTVSGQTATIDLDPGEDVTCTFYNQPSATFTVNKDFIPNDAAVVSVGLSCASGTVTTTPLNASEGSPAVFTITGFSGDPNCTATETVPVGYADDQSDCLNVPLVSDGVCTITNTEKGKIIVCKTTVGGDDSFEFNPSYAANFFLSDSQCNDSGPLAPGIYSVAEINLPTGWNLTSATCDDSSPVTAIDVSPGETVTCTFTNTLPPGKIIVAKVTIGGDDSFGFTGEITTTLSNGQSDEKVVTPGQYTVTESTIPAGWLQPPSISCDDANSTGTGTTATFNVEAGETVTCTFTNTAQGNIIVKKVTVGGDDSFEFSTSYGANFFLSNGQQNDSGPLAPGVYSVDEVNIPTGWTLTSATCDDGSPVTAIDVSAGETVTCTFTNNEPTLKVIKDVIPDNATTNWNIDIIGPTPFSDTLSGDDMTAQTTVDSGSYTITETAGANTDLADYNTSFACTGATPNPSGSGTVINVTVDLGENVVCTFTNKIKGVGGIVEFGGVSGGSQLSPSTESSAGSASVPSYGLLGMAIAASILVASGVWYARRRLLG